jgi:hypothetical protein
VVKVALAGYVREYVRRQVEAARDMVQGYGDRWAQMRCVLRYVI